MGWGLNGTPHLAHHEHRMLATSVTWRVAGLDGVLEITEPQEMKQGLSSCLHIHTSILLHVSTEKWGLAKGAWTGDQLSISQMWKSRAGGELWSSQVIAWCWSSSPSSLPASSITFSWANLGAWGGGQGAHNSVIALWILWGHIMVCCANFYEYLFYNVYWNH